MASISAANLYKALRAQNISPAGSIGLMANAAAESGDPANPLATYNVNASGGGLWQLTSGGNYPQSTITADTVAAQISYVKGVSSVQGCLKGSDPVKIAQCLSSSFEMCSQGTGPTGFATANACAPGGESYQQRAANAATLAKQAFYTGDKGAVAPGKSGSTNGSTRTGTGTTAGTSSGSNTGTGNAGTTGTAGTAATGPSTCTVLIHVTLLGDILNKCQVGAVVGAGLMLVGGLTCLAALFLIMRQAGTDSVVGAAGAAGSSALGKTPGIPSIFEFAALA